MIELPTNIPIGQNEKIMSSKLEEFDDLNSVFTNLTSDPQGGFSLDDLKEKTCSYDEGYGYILRAEFIHAFTDSGYSFSSYLIIRKNKKGLISIYSK